jgi:L-lactate dehydrogenase (cytochrome)
MLHAGVHGGHAGARQPLSRLSFGPCRSGRHDRCNPPRNAGRDEAALGLGRGRDGRPHALGNVARKLEGKTGIEDFFAWMRENFDSSISWRDLDFIRSEWKGPLVIKGLLDAEDAVEAANLGADGIVVSNHGGRQLDGVPSTARALPAIANAVGDRLTVLADGGVRSGLDVVRLLALGAKGVLLGRAWVFALAANGQAGVEHMLRLIEAEMRVAMTLTGVKTISEIDRSILVKP